MERGEKEGQNGTHAEVPCQRDTGNFLPRMRLLVGFEARGAAAAFGKSSAKDEIIENEI